MIMIGMKPKLMVVDRREKKIRLISWSDVWKMSKLLLITISIKIVNWVKMGTERGKNMTMVKKDTVIMYSNNSNIIITWQ